jgi:hypothetical protein
MARKPQKFTIDPAKFLDWALDENPDVLSIIEEELKTQYRVKTSLNGILQTIDGFLPPELVTNPEYFTIEQLTCIEACDCVFPPLH